MRAGRRRLNLDPKKSWIVPTFEELIPRSPREPAAGTDWRLDDSQAERSGNREAGLITVCAWRMGGANIVDGWHGPMRGGM